MKPQLISELVALLGSRSVLSRREDLMLYEYDGSVELGSPECVVFPASTAQVAQIVRLANQYETPLLGRGAGTGLSGGAISREGGIVVSFSRMNRILEIDPVNLRAVVQPGVVNLDISRAVEHLGLYFAPDPSSQKSSTIGGNVSENSGGPHTLAYGVTSNHVTGLELVLIYSQMVTAAFLVFAGVGMLMRPPIGMLIDKFGSRRLALPGAILVGLSGRGDKDVAQAQALLG